MSKKNPAPSSAPAYFQRSPIDLKDTVFHPFDNGQVEFRYPLSEVRGQVEGDPHHAKITILDDVRIPLFGMHLKLLQIHCHAPSEHTVCGVAWPLELHLVHEIVSGQRGATVGSTLLVIGVFFFASPDARTQRALPFLGAHLAEQKQDKGKRTARTPVIFDPNHCLPEEHDRDRFYRYEGSLTSGAMEETVSWLVFDRPVPVLSSDLRPILEAAEQPQQAIQPLNRRIVLRSFDGD